ncbi:hypothetical protein ACQ4PT_022913 [Festuca glaucescens]
MDLSSQRDGGVERSDAPQNSRAVRVEVVNGGCTEESFGAVKVEVVAEERNGAVGEKVAAAEGSDGGAASSASLETNCVGTGGEKIVASDGSVVAAGVGAATKTDVVDTGEGITAVEQMQGDSFYCHQCRQKRKGATPACKGGFKKKGKCLLKFCERCIRNRYSEIADQALNEEAWECPKCQNNCNCSICKKNKEEVPMGPMVRPGRKRKGSVDDTPANKKPRLGAENGTPANKNPPLGAENTYAPEDHIDLPRGTLVTCVAELEELDRALKAAPIRLDNGVAYWKLDGCSINNTNIMRQEFDDENTVKNKDKWFMFTEEEQKIIKDHLAKSSEQEL